ncbi:MAG: hypothetical protein WCK71_01990 [bacterium]
MKRRKALKQFRRMQRNLLRDRQVVEDILDEMASKWAQKADSIQVNARLAKHLAVGRSKKTN